MDNTAPIPQATAGGKQNFFGEKVVINDKHLKAYERVFSVKDA